MNNYEKKLQILDLTVTILLFVVDCIIGKFVMNVYVSWMGFNGPAIGNLLAGELLWFRVVRKAIIQKYERSKGD